MVPRGKVEWRGVRLGLCGLLAGIAVAAQELPGVEVLAELVVERLFAGSTAPVGGLSGLAYEPRSGLYYAISDDSSRLGPARLYELELAVATEPDRSVTVTVLREVVLRRADGSVFPVGSIDPESLALTPSGTWIVASEGNADRGIGPALMEFSREGAWIEELRLPRWLNPSRRAGVRHNLALESVTITPDGQWLFSGTENALRQDGLPATATAGSPSRLLRFDLTTRKLNASYLYVTEPVVAAPTNEEFAVNGLVDLLALDDTRLLALERSFTAGRGNTVRIYLVDLTEATEMKGRRRLIRGRAIRPVTKELLVDVAALGLEVDNLEAMAFGPSLANGLRTLILVADDNFNPGVQRSQVVVLVVGSAFPASPAI